VRIAASGAILEPTVTASLHGASATGTIRYVRRVPRTAPLALAGEELGVTPPPPVTTQQTGLATVLPIALPVIGGLSALIFVLVNPKPLYIAGGILFFFTAVSAGVAMAAQQRATFRAQLRAARGRYLEYLGEVRRDLAATAAAQRSDAWWRHPPPDALLGVAGTPHRVWERRATDPDFLAVRVGRATLPLATQLSTRQGGPAMVASDPVCVDALERLERAYRSVLDVPVAAPLARARVTTIVGPRQAAAALARALIAQVATWHTPNDVRLALCLSPEARPDWEWCKWLPHLFIWEAALTLPEPPAVCADATTMASALSALPRGDRVAEERTKAAGAWVVAVHDAGDPGPGRDQLLRQALGRRASLVVLVTDGDPEPAEVDLRIRVDGHGGLEVQLLGGGTPVHGRADHLGPGAAGALARRLAPLRLGRDDDAQRLQNTIELDRLLGVDDPAALDLPHLWRPRPLRERLRVAIGGDPKGADVVLDLKESALGGDGPHGLCIGATGSGKSELLRTVVTGLALTHPPDFLSFVLVDFKGGAAFAGLSELPHVAGVITNLADDLTLVDRMRDALFGEMRRRQELLKRAGNLGNLHSYHRQGAGATVEPLPYLLVMIDEFAELLAARPDFIELFVAIGRLGRSLGVHLMLASQQLEEGRLRGLEGHLSYRFALRTFSASESRTVIGTPDAYELPPLPGSGYLKVGTTVYTRFRAATVSLPYLPDDEQGWDHSELQPFGLDDLAAEAPAAAAAGPRDEDGPSPPSFLDVVVAQMRGAAPRVHQVWLPPLSPRLTLDAVLSEDGRAGELLVPIGLVDRPAEQRTEVLSLDFRTTSGHLMLAGSSQTGKTTLLRTLIASFALTHTPLEAQFYCVDYGGGGLAALAGLPHVGGVCGRNDEERLNRTFAEIAALLDERERRFAEQGIDSPQALRARRAAGEGADGSLADVFLVVDNWLAVRQQNEDLELTVLDVATRGLGYGVHLVLTASRWMDIRSALREAIGGRLELRLNDPTESAIDRRAAGNVAASAPGRGVTPDRLLFQTALPRTDGRGEVLGLPAALDQLVAGVAERWTGARAAPVRVLPRRLCLEQLPAAGEPAGEAVPIGISGRGMGVVRIDLSGSDPHFIALGDGESGKTTLLRTLVSGLVARLPAERARFFVVDYRRTMLGLVPESHMLAYAAAEPSAASAAAEIAQALERRLPRGDLTADELRTRSWWSGPEVYAVVDDYDLVGASGTNPFAPLVPYLAQARDVGLHVLVARRVAGASRALYDPFLGRIRELGSAGIVLAGDPQEGALLGAARPSAMPPGRGLLVRRRERPELVQIAISDC
jgi:S-DNA-T family DNA segregation ATPase FtsK/SpoIIIE